MKGKSKMHKWNESIYDKSFLHTSWLPRKCPRTLDVGILLDYIHFGKCFTYVTKTRANLTGELQRHHYFCDWYHEKLIPNQFKSLSNLTFSKMFRLFLLLWFTLKLSWECCESSRKEATFWFCCGKNVNMLKSIIWD